MILKTYFSKNNTIVSNNPVNTSRNPVTELFYGSKDGNNQYSRFLFYFDETRLKSLYTGGTFTDLTKLKHTLKLTNTGSFDEKLLNNTYESKDRASSFDLILFKISQDWDEGTGYDYSFTNFTNGCSSISTNPSNWVNSQTGIDWINGTGVYSGSPSGITVTTQHFDKGNENIEMDITNYVNGVLTGDTNYGLGIAFARGYELTNTTTLQYVGFFTNKTQTFYEPFIETTYSNHIIDDRNDFYLDKHNKLYLYVNLASNPTNLDNIPSVTVYDQNDGIFSSYTSSAVTHVTKGVYSIDIIVPTSQTNESTMFTDIWSGITINGVQRPNISMNFALKNSIDYYNIGSNDELPKKVGISVSGIKDMENIIQNDIRKVIVSARIPYTINQTQNISDIKYRLYVTEGKNQVTVTDFHPIERANNYYYFLLDTGSLLPNKYYIDIQVNSNLEVTTITDVISFNVVSQSNFRN